MFVRQEDRIFAVPTRAPVGDKIKKRAHIHDRPGFFQQALTRCIWVWCMADDGNDFIDICNREGKANQDVRPVTRFIQLKLSPAGDNFFAEANESLQNLAQIKLLRTSTV